MADPKPPAPSNEPSPPEPAEAGGAETGERMPKKDMRETFARMSRGRSDPEAERAFVESKIEMIRTDPKLTEAEKAGALAELEAKLEGES